MKKYLIFIIAILLMQVAVAQTCNDNIIASTPDSRFIVNGDEVTDTETGLIWQRCSLGQTENDCSSGFRDSFTWQEALQAASAPWRLPNINELRSIVEEKCYDDAINLTVFPPGFSFSAYHWSSSSYADDSNSAWYVNFYNGHPSKRAKSIAHQVRLVRDAQ